MKVLYILSDFRGKSALFDIVETGISKQIFRQYHFFTNDFTLLYIGFILEKPIEFLKQVNSKVYVISW